MGEAILKHTPMQPSAALRPFVKRFESIHSFTERVIHFCPTLHWWQLSVGGGAARSFGFTAAAISGLQDRAANGNASGREPCSADVFTEAGATAFLHEPLDQLLNQMTPIECLLRRSQLMKFRSIDRTEVSPAEPCHWSDFCFTIAYRSA